MHMIKQTTISQQANKQTNNYKQRRNHSHKRLQATNQTIKQPTIHKQSKQQTNNYKQT